MSVGKLPEGWVTSKFIELMDIQGGTQPPKSEFISEGKEGYVRLLQIRDFGNKPVPTYIPETQKLKKCIKSDLLIGRYGASLGRICTGHSGAYNVALAKVIYPQQIKRLFIKHYLESEVFQLPLRLLSRSAQNGFNKEDLSKFDFILPPRAEQKIIAEKLDTLLAQVDSTKARLEQIPKILKRFRQAVLASAIEGSLTEKWRDVNYIKSGGWQTLTIEQLAAKEKYSLGIGPFGSNLKVTDYRDVGHPLIFVRDIRADDFQNKESRYIDSSKFDELKAHRAKPGDIVITKMGDPPGDAAIYPAGCEEAVITADCIKLNVDNKLAITKFILIAITSNNFRRKVIDISAGVAQQKVNLKNFKKLEIKIPPLPEQQEIVRRVEQLFAYADTIEKQVNTALSRINHLTQSILAKAFRGELTAQWREENPDLISGENSAASLLEKIKAERAASAGKKASRKKG